VKLALIVAIAHNRAIGMEGRLPWHISEDLKRFKKLTTGHAVIMGRRTYESIGRPLPNRRNVVVTSRSLPAVETYPTLSQALDALSGEERVFVIGGGRLYTEALPKADELYLTLVGREVEADTFFPPYERLLEDSFIMTSRADHEGFSFVDYARK
jgi:dihydrofolate reductase